MATKTQENELNEFDQLAAEIEAEFDKIDAEIANHEHEKILGKEVSGQK